jgi:hypothetical protein
MMRNRLSVRSVAVSTVALVGSLLFTTGGGALAANTRMVYFGAPPNVCPLSPTDTACGGGLDASGKPINGVLVFSPPTPSTSTLVNHYVAYRLQVSNTSGSTLTHVVVLGGALAGLTTNPLFPPPTTPSLPGGLKYWSVTTLSGPTPSCATTSTQFRCDFGNIAAGTAATVLNIVLLSPTTVPNPASVVPWNELQVNEGSSNTGGNADSFYAVGQDGGLVIRASTLNEVESYILPAGLTLSTEDNFAASDPNRGTTRITVPLTTNGDDARIIETPLDPQPGCAGTSAPKLICIVQTSSVSVLTPINLIQGAGSPDTFTPAHPLKLEFRFDSAALVGGATQKKLQLVDDGTLVGFCASDPPSTTETFPCRLPTVKFDDGDLGITAYGLKNGNWKPGY